MPIGLTRALQRRFVAGRACRPDRNFGAPEPRVPRAHTAASPSARPSHSLARVGPFVSTVAWAYVPGGNGHVCPARPAMPVARRETPATASKLEETGDRGGWRLALARYRRRRRGRAERGFGQDVRVAPRSQRPRAHPKPTGDGLNLREMARRVAPSRLPGQHVACQRNRASLSRPAAKKIRSSLRCDEPLGFPECHPQHRLHRLGRGRQIRRQRSGTDGTSQDHPDIDGGTAIYFVILASSPGRDTDDAVGGLENSNASLLSKV